MSQQLDKLKRLMRELFQLDQSDLDFGIYRIMNQKREEIESFLDKDLLPQVKEELGRYQSEESETLSAEYDKAVKQAQDMGVNPDDVPKVKELKAKLEAGADLDALEAQVYSDLYNFFRRYYSEGDFISQRRYKEGVYAIPYEGEEVKLYWANHDQYYIKSSDYLRNYAFKLSDGRRVRFKVVDASEETGNNKATNGKDRKFRLCEENPLIETDGELHIRFTHLPDKTKQSDLINAAVEHIFQETGLSDWTTELAEPKPTEKNPKRTLLEKHLSGFTARNTFDYFIHKDLGGFLRRELDFYIKNEIMHLDDIENDDAPRVEQYLSKIRAMRRIGGKIIQFLEQLENFQKRLWLKKKFVVETNYCITLDRVPHELYQAICDNEAQRLEWVDLFAIDQIEGDLHSPGYSNPLTIEFLQANSYLVLDTKHFDDEFKNKLLASIDDFDEQCDGVLIHSENFQALNSLQEKHREAIKCIYIDPPYNIGDDDGFYYKDNYQHSSWLSMIYDRARISKSLSSRESAILVSIDENEHSNLKKALDLIWGKENFISDMVWAAGRKNDSKLISISHQYIVVYSSDRALLSKRNVHWRQKKKGLDSIYKQYEKIKKKHGTDYKSMTIELKRWFKELPDSHPAKPHKHYSHIDERGIYFPDNISWPGGGGPKYKVLHPVTKKAVKVPRSGFKSVSM